MQPSILLERGAHTTRATLSKRRKRRRKKKVRHSFIVCFDFLLQASLLHLVLGPSMHNCIYPATTTASMEKDDSWTYNVHFTWSNKTRSMHLSLPLTKATNSHINYNNIPEAENRYRMYGRRSNWLIKFDSAAGIVYGMSLWLTTVW